MILHFTYDMEGCKDIGLMVLDYGSVYRFVIRMRAYRSLLQCS